MSRQSKVMGELWGRGRKGWNEVGGTHNMCTFVNMVGRIKNSVLNLKCDILDGDDDFSGNNKNEWVEKGTKSHQAFLTVILLLLNQRQNSKLFSDEKRTRRERFCSFAWHLLHKSVYKRRTNAEALFISILVDLIKNTGYFVQSLQSTTYVHLFS